MRKHGANPDALIYKRKIFSFSCCPHMKYICFHDIQDSEFSGNMFLFAQTDSKMQHMFECLEETVPDENIAALVELNYVDAKHRDIGFVLVLPINYDPMLIALDLKTKN